MQSKAKTVQEYLAQLPAERRAALAAVRGAIRKNLDRGFEEGMQYGMIGYYVPHRLYPDGYHCDPRQPLPFAGLASQKNYMSVYLMSVYAAGTEEQWLRKEWAKAGKKLDMGKCCIRFKKLDDVPLNVLGEVIRRVTVKNHIAHYEAAIKTMNKTMNKRASGSASKSSRAAGPSRSAKPARKRS